MNKLPDNWEIPAIFHQRLGNRVGRQRAMFEESHLLLVLHAPPKPDEQQRSGRFFWRDSTGTWRSTQKGMGIKALSNHIDEFLNELEECEQLDTSAKSANDYFAVLERLSPIMRCLGNLHQVLQDARKLVKEDRDIINLRDRAYDLTRTAELLFTSAKNAVDFMVAKQAEEQSQASHQMAVSAHRLNMLAAIFFPIATLTAIFSTNFSSGLEEKYGAPWPLLILLGSGLLIGLILVSLVGRK